MKRLFVIAAVMLSAVGVAFAGEAITVPNGANSNPIPADYGGVDVYTASFTFAQAVSSGFTNRGVSFQSDISSRTAQFGLSILYGADFSTGACNDFVDFFQSTGAFVDARFITRLYNVGGSTQSATATAGVSCAGFQGWRYPIRAYGNIFAKSNSITYNGIAIHYWKEP